MKPDNMKPDRALPFVDARSVELLGDVAREHRAAWERFAFADALAALLPKTILVLGEVPS